MRNRSKIAPTVDSGGPPSLQTQFEGLVTQVQHLPRDHYQCQGCYYAMGPWVQAYGLKIRRRRVLAYCRSCTGKIIRDLTTLIELDAERERKLAGKAQTIKGPVRTTSELEDSRG